MNEAQVDRCEAGAWALIFVGDLSATAVAEVLITAAAVGLLLGRVLPWGLGAVRRCRAGRWSVLRGLLAVLLGRVGRLLGWVAVLLLWKERRRCVQRGDLLSAHGGRDGPSRDRPDSAG